MRRVFVRNGSRIAAVEDLPASPVGAVELQARGYAVCLDPSATAAYAVVGVMLDEPGASVVLLRPGEWYYAPQPFRRLFVFNAMGWLIARASIENRPAGRLTFMVSETESEAVRYQDQQLAGPRGGQVASGQVNATIEPSLNTTFLQGLGWAEQLTPNIPAQGIRKARVTVHPITAPGALVNPIPVDFAVTLRPWVCVAIKTQADRVSVLPNNSGAWQGQPWSEVDDEPGNVVWLPHAAGDLNVTPTDCVCELDVPSGLMFAFQRIGLVGTGVASVWVTVEVY